MKTWHGATAVVMQEARVLMVRAKGCTGWTVPSGEIEKGESAEVACVREALEETGYNVRVVKPLHMKEAVVKDYAVTTSYFLCEVVGGATSYEDPDEEIEEVAWKSVAEVATLPLLYPEDRTMIQRLFVKQ